MSKIRNEVIKNFIQTNPTSKEIDFLIHIAMYQDADGICRGIYYKDVMESLPCCKQTFYSVMQSLKDKKIIEINRESDIDYDITIVGNTGNYQDGYLSARKPVLHTQDFKSLPAGAKMIALDILIIVGSNGTAWDIGKEKFFKKYGVEDDNSEDVKCVLPFKIKRRTLHDYMKLLKKLFIFKKARDKNDKPKFCIIKRWLKDAERPENYKTDNQMWAEHLAEVLCRRQKMYCGNRIKYDLYDYIKQYKIIAETHGKSICRILISSFHNSLEKLQKNIFNPKLIHKYIRHELFGDPILF